MESGEHVCNPCGLYYKLKGVSSCWAWGAKGCAFGVVRQVIHCMVSCVDGQGVGESTVMGWEGNSGTIQRAPLFVGLEVYSISCH